MELANLRKSPENQRPGRIIPALKRGLTEGLAIITIAGAFGVAACRHKMASSDVAITATSAPIKRSLRGDASIERLHERVRSIGDEEMLESQVILSVSDDGRTLSAEVITFTPVGDLRERMEEIVERCRSVQDVQICIQNEASAIIDAEFRPVDNPNLAFDYYDQSEARYTSLNDMGLVSGSECNISNLSPSGIRVSFLPEADQNVTASSAAYDMRPPVASTP